MRTTVTIIIALLIRLISLGQSSYDFYEIGLLNAKSGNYNIALENFTKSIESYHENGGNSIIEADFALALTKVQLQNKEGGCKDFQRIHNEVLFRSDESYLGKELVQYFSWIQKLGYQNCSEAMKALCNIEDQPMPETLDWYKQYFLKNITSLDEIEGVWTYNYNSVTKMYYDGGPLTSIPLSTKAIAVIVKKDVGYKMLYCGFDLGFMKVYESSTKEEFRKTATKGLYLVDLIDHSGEKINEKARLEDGIMTYSYSINNSNNGTYSNQVVKFELIKISPTENDVKQFQTKPAKISGTGVAISNSGYLITNYHVAGFGSEILVTGINVLAP